MLSGWKIRVNGKMVAFSREEIAMLCHIRLVSPASSILLRIQEDGMKFLRAAGLLIVSKIAQAGRLAGHTAEAVAKEAATHRRHAEARRRWKSSNQPLVGIG
jgi:hypothetical protein